jgi:hypothetical protein
MTTTNLILLVLLLASVVYLSIKLIQYFNNKYKDEIISDQLSDYDLKLLSIKIGNSLHDIGINAEDIEVEVSNGEINVYLSNPPMDKVIEAVSLITNEYANNNPINVIIERDGER